jgi:hypothetical protein
VFEEVIAAWHACLPEVIDDKACEDRLPGGGFSLYPKYRRTVVPMFPVVVKLLLQDPYACLGDSSILDCEEVASYVFCDAEVRCKALG